MRVILAVGLLFTASQPAFAQRALYVDGTNGNDSVTRAANGPENPWRTIGRAAWGSTNRSAPNPSEAAQAGDTVHVAAGTYNYSGTVNNRWGVVYNPANNGTASSPITFRAQGTVALTAPATASPVIGCASRNYITWSGPFLLDEASISIHADTGSVVLNGATGCVLDGITIDGDGEPGYADNHNGVRVEGCTNCVVRNSVIHDVYANSGTAAHNGAAVMLYNSDDTVIEGNTIFRTGTGVFIKGVFGTSSPQERTIVRHNLIYQAGKGIITQDSMSDLLYQNVIRDGNYGISLFGRTSATYAHPVNTIVANNTIDGMNACIVVEGGQYHENVRVSSNVVTACGFAILMEDLASPGDISFQHNTYYGFSTFAQGAGPAYTLSSWRSAFPNQDASAPASSTSDPRYVNGPADDFRLCTGAGAPATSCTGASTVLASGRDILDLDRDGSTTDTIRPGAYVTGNEIIGSGGGGSNPPPSTIPSAPRNLRITTP